MDEEVDDILFDLFIADYVDVTPVLPKPTFSKSARSMVSPLTSISSDNQKRVTMVSKAIKTTRKTAYSIVKEFADKVCHFTSNPNDNKLSAQKALLGCDESGP